jgi:hypothetical protein
VGTLRFPQKVATLKFLTKRLWAAEMLVWPMSRAGIGWGMEWIGWFMLVDVLRMMKVTDNFVGLMWLVMGRARRVAVSSWGKGCQQV